MTIGLCARDVEHGFTEPGHVRNFTEDCSDSVDFTVVVDLGQDIAKSVRKFTTLDVLNCKRIIVDASESRNSDFTSRRQETPITVLISIGHADWNPVGVFVKVF